MSQVAIGSDHAGFLLKNELADIFSSYDSVSARLSREHNDANVACFGARLIGTETVKEALKVFCETEFEGGRHAARVRKLDEII